MVYLALKHNIKAVPIVSQEGYLLKVVLSDKILHILHQEMREDLLKHVGVMKFEADETVTGFEIST